MAFIWKKCLEKGWEPKSRWLLSVCHIKAKLIILIEEEMPIRRNNMARYWQNFDNEELEDSNDEEWQKLEKKESRVQFNTYIKGVFSKLI